MKRVLIIYLLTFASISTYALLVDPLTSIDRNRLSPCEHKLFQLIYHQDVELLRADLSAQLDPNMLLGNYTLLTFALANHNIASAQCLITQCGADVNKLDKNELSPLVYALSKKHWNMAQLLVDYGAGANLPQGGAQSGWGTRSPFWIFLTAINKREYIWEHYLDQMKWLLAHNASPNALTEQGANLLRIAMQHRDSKRGTKVIKWLCRSGADINYPMSSYRNKTVVHHCAHRAKHQQLTYQVKNLEFLLRAGGDINAQDEDFRTPLHEAVINNEEPDTPVCCGAEQTNADCIAYLLCKGADPFLWDSKGFMPVDYARQPEVIAMLENPKKVILPERVKKILDSLKKVPCEKLC